MEVLQRARQHVLRVAICLIEERTDRLLDSWLVFENGKYLTEDVLDMSKGKAAQDVSTETAYAFTGSRKAENDGDT